MAIRTTSTGGLTIPPASSLAAVAGGRRLAGAGARSLVPVTYGTDRVPALVLNVLPAATAGTVLVQCLWGHGCHAISEPRINDQALPAGASSTHYTGAQTTPDAALVAAFAAQGITYTDALTGFAFTVFALPVSGFDGQLQLSVQIAGRRVYDPRKDSTAGGSGAHRLADPTTWEWSDNPSLALADWLASSTYGPGETVAWASVPAAANANDATVTGIGGTEKRRIVGVTLAQPALVGQVADALRAYAGCWLVPTAAGLKLLPDADGASVASYAHSTGQIAALDGLTLRDLGNVPTAVEVIYTDASQIPWRTASATQTLPGAGTTRPWRLSTVQMPGVHRFSQAMREATERLNKLLLSDLATTVEVFDIGIRHEIGDIVDLTHPIGLVAKPMRVTDVFMPTPGRWRLAVAEHDPAAYSGTVQTKGTIPDTPRDILPAVPAQPSGLAFAFEPYGVRLYCAANAETYVSGYEWRLGATWETAVVRERLGGTSHALEVQTTGAKTAWVAAVDFWDRTSTPASVSVPIGSASIGSLTALVVGADLQLDYTGVPGAFAVTKYELRHGNDFATAAVVGLYLVTRHVRRVDWLGARRWWVVPIDAKDNYGVQSSVDVSVTAPGVVTSQRAEVVDNNALLYWGAPGSGTLPVERYEVRKGASWAAGTPIGSNGNSTFTTVFEQAAGSYSYWIAAVDTAGNFGVAVAITATINQPPDYVLRSNFLDDFTGTLSGMHVEGGKVYGPSLGETIQTHFESRGWATPDDQINAGYPLVFMPSGTSGYYERAIDYGALLPATVITVTPTIAVLSGVVASQCQIWYKAAAGDPWIAAPVGALQVLAPSGFRYVAVRLTFTASGGDDLAELSALNIKLSHKLKTDSGNGTANAADSGGTSVTFGVPFIDVDSITVTPGGTAARYAIYDFVDAPNPTTFKALLFDNNGNRVSGPFSWAARGY